jgi:phosphohistidine phosphatase
MGKPLLLRRQACQPGQMKILLIRHAIAAPRDEFPGEDKLRPLTEKGKKRARRAFYGLKRAYPEVAQIFFSPAVRASHTARLLKRFYSGPNLVETSLLGPDSESYLDLESLLKESGASSIALVGHEPNLTHFAAHLLQMEKLPFEIGKAGVLVLESDELGIRMESLLTPRVLRRLYG